MLRTLGTVCTLALLVACKGGRLTTDDSTPADDSTPVEDEFSPVVTNSDAYCHLHSTGDEFYEWIVTASADDPQGVDTLEVWASLEVSRGGGLITTETLVVDRDSGDVVGSFPADRAGISCSSAAEYVFRFEVTDEDGNVGFEEVVGREE